MRSLVRQRTTKLVLGAAVVLAFAAGAAYATAAATSGADTVIVACQNHTNGLLRVVTDAANCRRHETALSWNVQGPQGPPGPPGPPGLGAGALAFAHVLADGTLDTSRSSASVLAVTRTFLTGSSPGIPLYCFNLNATPKSVTATTQITPVQIPPVTGPPSIGVLGGLASATVDQSAMAALGCGAGTEAAVTIAGGGSTGQPFYVVFN